MAIHQTGLPLHSARVRDMSDRVRQISVPRVFPANELRLVVGAIVIVCILSILFLAQTGRVATAGHRLEAIEREHVALVQEAQQYEYRIARASRLDMVAERAARLGLRPATSEQLVYETVDLPMVPVTASTSER